jgi:hypothetical protein
MASLLSIAYLLSFQALAANASPLESLNFLRPRASASKATVGPYTYQGCFAEPSTGRALAGVWSDASMTLEKCADYAASKQHAWFGVEYSRIAALVILLY